MVLSATGDVTAAKGPKFTSESRRRAGTGSNRLRGRGGEGGGSSRVGGRCAQLWRADEVEGGLGRAARPRRWKAAEIWRTLRTWSKERVIAVKFSCHIFAF